MSSLKDTLATGSYISLLMRNSSVAGSRDETQLCPQEGPGTDKLDHSPLPPPPSCLRVWSTSWRKRTQAALAGSAEAGQAEQSRRDFRLKQQNVRDT